MNYIEFRTKLNGKYCEMGGSANAKNQCTDLANAYISEVLGLPIVLGTNAVDFPKKCLPPNYEYILNDPNNADQVPIQGDIMIWISPDGIGHIGVFDNGKKGVNSFVSFDQNWPVGSVCKLVTHTYTGTYKVVGWLRGKPNTDINIYKGLDLTNKDSMKVAVDVWADLMAGKYKNASEFETLNKDLEKKNKQISDLLETNKNLVSKVDIIEAKLADNLEIITNQQSELLTAKESSQIIQEQLDAMTASKNQYKGWYEASLAKQINKLTKKELISYLLSNLFKK